MYAASSAVVWDMYPRSEKLVTVKKSKNKSKKKSNVANKDYLESFRYYYENNINEVVQPNKVPASQPEPLEPVIFYTDSSTRIKYPENGEYFEPQELRQLVQAKRVKVVPYGPEGYLIIDLDGDTKPINVKGCILLNSVNNTGEIVGGNCMLVPADMMP